MYGITMNWKLKKKNSSFTASLRSSAINSRGIGVRPRNESFHSLDSVPWASYLTALNFGPLIWADLDAGGCVSLKWATSSPCREMGDNFDTCATQRSITYLNMLQMWFVPQLCEQTDSCVGYQLSYNNTVSVPALAHTPGRKYFGNRDRAQWTGCGYGNPVVAAVFRLDHMWQFTLGHCESKNFAISSNNSWRPKNSFPGWLSWLTAINIEDVQENKRKKKCNLCGK